MASRLLRTHMGSLGPTAILSVLIPPSVFPPLCPTQEQQMRTWSLSSAAHFCHSPQVTLIFTELGFILRVKFRFLSPHLAFRQLSSSWKPWLIFSSVSHPFKFISRGNMVSSPTYQGHGTSLLLYFLKQTSFKV